ncbi:4-hydroxybenzoate octaprenyltransferase [Methylocystis heyeri]|uniref:4-hydroxybenzoate octaprenyltransferase n=1 Tax=Methylocystis heyeri TaxID=391905 RepID=A0A6B8KH19_9HYPH|nr:4-hydroxybenzoate octaprenyltransferase [Methylocystis heyeri]QGM47017.1 4-hydroxybenzoate octaprenyltransferase [Methylocystis heyeri]
MTLTQNQSGAAEALPDAVSGHPLLRLAPAPVKPFIQLARLDRPIGWWLLLLPCWESSALAAAALGAAPDIKQLALFFLGAVSMRGAGSTYNDLVDRNIDAQVERTRNRPLASGRVSARAAIVFLVAQCLVGLFVLLSFNGLTIALALASPLIVLLYPFAKRFTSWPQAILGCAFAYGGLLGWTARTGSFDWPALLLYLSAIFWTIGYDTIYALQDVKDDARAGVLSTARLFGSRVRLAVGTLYAISAIFAWVAVAAAHLGVFAHLGALAFAAHLAWQARQVGEDCPPALALTLFRANRDAGLLLFAGFLVQSLASTFHS